MLFNLAFSCFNTLICCFKLFVSGENLTTIPIPINIPNNNNKNLENKNNNKQFIILNMLFFLTSGTDSGNGVVETTGIGEVDIRKGSSLMILYIKQ